VPAQGGVARVTVARLATIAWLAASAPCALAEPPVLFGGRLVLGGEASGTIAPEDEGYFNYNDYSTQSLRLFRLSLAAEARLARPLTLLGEVRSDNLASPRVYALYLRLRPWARRELDVQAGLVPPVFGAFPRRRYAYDNPLPSLPLAFQYLTTLRYDALPANAEQVVAQRGRGWEVSYPIGAGEAAAGVPLVSAERWDAGVELRLGREPLSLAVALTQGSLSHPRFEDDNDGKQIAGRLQWKPGPALTVGASVASGAFVSREAKDALPPSARGDFRQQALGLDLEWARGYWIVRAEAVWSRWNLPALDETRIVEPLDALGAYAEARYKLRPGLYLAGRLEHLGFSRIDSSLGRRTWDAPVTRVELGAGYTLRRHVLLKASWQHNRRDGGRVPENDLVAAQVLLWF
jgi:hypothetical protein